MALFRKRPVVVAAEQFFPPQKPWPLGVYEKTSDYCSDPECGDSSWDHDCELGSATGTYAIRSKDVIMDVVPGAWIITGIQGERYPCDPEIFAATYEAV